MSALNWRAEYHCRREYRVAARRRRRKRRLDYKLHAAAAAARVSGYFAPGIILITYNVCCCPVGRKEDCKPLVRGKEKLIKRDRVSWRFCEINVRCFYSNFGSAGRELDLKLLCACTAILLTFVAPVKLRDVFKRGYLMDSTLWVGTTPTRVSTIS